MPIADARGPRRDDRVLKHDDVILATATLDVTLASADSGGWVGGIWPDNRDCPMKAIGLIIAGCLGDQDLR